MLRVLSGCVVAAALVFAVLPAMAQSCLGARDVKSEPKIVGGWKAKIAAWPGQVVIRAKVPGAAEATYFCGGTAIAPYWVLTAAHCLDDVVRGAAGRYLNGDSDRVDMVFGTDRLRRLGPGNIRQIENIIIHENYKTGGHDIALVKLAAPWDGPLSRLSLARTTDGPTGARAMVAGFGLTKDRKQGGGIRRFKRKDASIFWAGSDRLLQTAVPVVDTARCAKRYAESIGDGQICAGLEEIETGMSGRDSCQGDSGGPLKLFTRDGCPYQVGVVSGGAGCAKAKYYGIYTRVSHFAPWIRRHVPSVQAVAGYEVDDKISTEESRRLADLAVRQLSETLGVGAKDGVTLRLLRADGRALAAENHVQIGDQFLFEISSEIDGRLILVDVNADGNITQLFPNGPVNSGRLSLITSNTTVVIPTRAYGFPSFRADPPPGQSRVIALVVPKDFPVKQFIAAPARMSKGFVPETEPANYLMRLVAQIVSFWQSRDASGQPPQWAWSVTAYEFLE